MLTQTKDDLEGRATDIVPVTMDNTQQDELAVLEELKDTVYAVMLSDRHDATDKVSALMTTASNAMQDRQALSEPAFVMGYAFALASLIECRNKMLQDETLTTCATEYMLGHLSLARMMRGEGQTISQLCVSLNRQRSEILHSVAMMSALRLAKRVIMGMEARIRLTDFGEKLLSQIEEEVRDEL